LICYWDLCRTAAWAYYYMRADGCRPTLNNSVLNQSIKMYLYSAISRKRIRGACWAGLGRVFTFAVRSVKQFSFHSTPETTERVRYPTATRLVSRRLREVGYVRLRWL